MKISILVKELKQKIFVRFCAFSLVLIGLLVVVFYSFQLLPAQKRLLKDKLLDRAKTISNISSPIIIKALDTKDDITLLSQIDNIMKYADDVNIVYILDSEGRVIAHNKTGEWGKIYSDPNTKKAISSKTDIISKTAEPAGFLQSHPLIGNDRIGTLFIGISSQKMNEAFSTMIANALYSAIPTFLLVVLAFLMFVSREITAPVIKFGKILNSILLGRGNEYIHSYKNDEVGQIAYKINGIIDKFTNDIKSAQDKVNDSKEKSVLFLTELSKLFPDGLIITNSEDKVIFLNEKAAATISVSSTESVGKHVLDLTSNNDFIELVKKSMNNSNKLIVENLHTLSKTAKIIAVNKGSDLVGTIIMFI